MISNKDRSGWFGASDMKYIMSNWNTKTFFDWWNVKLGITHRDFESDAMKAGSAYEGRVLDAVGVKRRNRQIRIHKYGLRVNLDGEIGHAGTISAKVGDDVHVHTGSHVVEVKTHKSEKYKMPDSVWYQVQAQVFAASYRRLKVTQIIYKLHPAFLLLVMRLMDWLGLYELLLPFDGFVVAYRLLPDDYDNYYNEIDTSRLSHFFIPFDDAFMTCEMLPRLSYLKECLKTGIAPNINEFTRRTKDVK